ncbi:HAMP domain-containing protein, partial [bacterium]|nr:HAMP domain-containing protein [bacterium]
MASRLDDVAIGKKLVGGFLITGLLAVVVAIAAGGALFRVSAAGRDLDEQVARPAVHMGVVTAQYGRIRAAVVKMSLAHDAAGVAALSAQVDDAMRVVDQERAQVEASVQAPAIKRAIAEFADADRAYRDWRGRYEPSVVAVVSAGGQPPISKEGNAVSTRISASMDALNKAILDESKTIAERNASLVHWAVGFVALVLVLGGAGLVLFARRLTRSIVEPLGACAGVLHELSLGHLGARVDSTRADELGDMGRTMDQFAAGLQLLVAQMKKIADGNLDARVAAHDAADEVAPALNGTVDAVGALIEEMERLSKDAVEGRLAARGDAARFHGAYREVVQGVNDTLDAVIVPLNVAADYLDKIAKGEIPAPIAQSYNGDFNTIKNNLNTCVAAVGALVADARTLADAARAGRFETRADVSRHQGDFRAIVEGVNATLDVVVDKVFWYEAILDSVPFPVSVTDSGLRWTFVNKATEEYLGRRRAELAG